jgi:uncharacterized phage protein (TIGR02220 family)
MRSRASIPFVAIVCLSPPRRTENDLTIRIKNWERFQHFKNRRPPWIKLYREILDDPEWHELDPQSSKVLVMLWLIASENKGDLPAVKKLAFRLRMFEKQLLQTLTKLSHWLIQDDITEISERYRDATPEQETETETETYKEEAEGEKETPLSGKPDDAPPYSEIVNLLNEKSGKNFRASGKETQSHIHARWKDGFTIDQFKVVIEKKCAQWRGDPRMDAYMRPQTIFGTKFEAYLNEKEVKGNGSGNKGVYGSSAQAGNIKAKPGKYAGIGTVVCTDPTDGGGNPEAAAEDSGERGSAEKVS